MNMDRKRINGPEMSVRPVIEPEFQPQLSNVLIDSNLQRKDNRNSDQIRPVFIKPNLIPQANGSAYIELGDTKLVVSVFGPRQNKRMAFSPSGQLTCEFKFSTFACEQRRGHIRDNEEKDISQLILAALVPAIKLENYPKSLIDIYITVLENGGTQSCLAAGITASSVALATAGIEMLDLVAASSGVSVI
jgi:exosome complex component MTR3